MSETPEMTPEQKAAYLSDKFGVVIDPRELADFDTLKPAELSEAEKKVKEYNEHGMKMKSFPGRSGVNSVLLIGAPIEITQEQYFEIMASGKRIIGEGAIIEPVFIQPVESIEGYRADLCLTGQLRYVKV